jgi:hypothetical protein
MYMIYTRSVIGGVCHTDTITYISRTEISILFNDDSVSVIDDIENCFLPRILVFYRIRATTMT